MAKVGSELPDGWIRKESSSRPNHFYYFNRKTGKTQWDAPNEKEKANQRDERSKYSKCDNLSKNRSPNRSRISDKSKDVRKTKTPAQDRLQKLVKKKVFAENVKELFNETASANDKKKRKPSIENLSAKKPCTSAKASGDQVDLIKSSQIVQNSDTTSVDVQLRVRKQSITKIKNSTPEKLSTLFSSSKTPAQDRLDTVRRNALTNMNERDATLFQNSFEVSNTTQSTDTDNNMDEEMEWEDCGETVDELTYSFQELEDMVVEVLADSSNSAFIVPDTNVFLDSLAPIKCVMEKDPKYSILVPFVVLQELDSLKSRRDQGLLNTKASRAIRYIYDQLKAKNQRMQGQKATEDNAPIINVKCADDKILNCCLQLQTKTNDVVLLTNDINLSNKAIMNGIEAITSKQFLEKFP